MDTKELIKVATRPVLLVLIFVAACIFETQGFESTFVTAVQTLAIAGASEWILERAVPVSYRALKTLRRSK